MPSNRRQFLWGGPTGLLAFSRLAGLAQAQSRSGKGGAVAEDVVSFWANHMGVPADMLVGGEQAVNGSRGTQTPADYGREPLFLHMDEEEKTLVFADELPKQKLMANGDAQVDVNLQRLRLSSTDKVQFQKYSSGGIYFDFQQEKTSGTESLLTMASSVFSAIFPNGFDGIGGGKKSSAPASSAAGSSGKSSSSKPAQASATSSNPRKITADVAASVPLQKSTESQSIALAGGVGKTAFSCFVKGRKSVFGSFLSTFQQFTDPSMPYMPLISIPLMAAPALTGIRALVANLQAHGGDQQWLLQGPQIDLAATGEALNSAPQGLRLRSGYYVVVPKSQSAALKEKLDKLKIIDGFLVPKEATRLDVFDAAPTVIPEMTYLSLRVNVRKAKAQSCLIPSAS